MSAHADHKYDDSPVRQGEEFSGEESEYSDHDIENPKPRKPVKVGKKERKEARRAAKKKRKEARRAARATAQKRFTILVTVIIALIIGSAVFGAYLLFFKTKGDTKVPTNDTPDEKAPTKGSDEEAPPKLQKLPEKISIKTSQVGAASVFHLRDNQHIHFKRVDGIQKLYIEADASSKMKDFVKGSIYVVDTDHHNLQGSDANLQNLYNCILFQVKDKFSGMEGYHWVFGISKALCGVAQFDQRLKTWCQTPSVDCFPGLYATKVGGKGVPIPSQAKWHPCDLKYLKGGAEKFVEKIANKDNEQYGHPTFTCVVEK